MFDPDAFLWSWCGRLLDVMILSVLWFFCSLPVVTIGPASAALYDAAVRGLAQGDPAPWSRFFRTFRAELKIGVLATLLWGTALAALAAVRAVLWTSLGGLPAATGSAVLLFALGAVSWVFPLLSRYEFSLGGLSRTALQFFVVHLPSSAALGLLLAVSAELCLRFVFPIFFLPCVEALLASRLVERAFRRHTPPEEAPAAE